MSLATQQMGLILENQDPRNSPSAIESSSDVRKLRSAGVFFLWLVGSWRNTRIFKKTVPSEEQSFRGDLLTWMFLATIKLPQDLLVNRKDNFHLFWIVKSKTSHSIHWDPIGRNPSSWGKKTTGLPQTKPSMLPLRNLVAPARILSELVVNLD